MPNLVDVTYEQSGKSIATNKLGMREMQARAYELRQSQYLLIKSPPASGKSRALMFLGLDKLINQGLKKGAVGFVSNSRDVIMSEWVVLTVRSSEENSAVVEPLNPLNNSFIGK